MNPLILVGIFIIHAIAFAVMAIRRGGIHNSVFCAGFLLLASARMLTPPVAGYMREAGCYLCALATILFIRARMNRPSK